MTDMPISQQENPLDDPGRALTQQEIARAAIIVMASYVLSGVLGLVRQMVLASAFGADRELDAFYAALRVPETLLALIAGGALGSAFIPVFSGFLGRDEFDDAWQLASTVMTLVTIVATIAAGIGLLLAPFLIGNLLLPGADSDTQALAVEMMRVMLISVIIFGLSGLLMGILNAYQHFVAPALAPSMYNLGIILGALFLVPSLGVHGLAWGVVIGAALHLVVQIPVASRLPFRRLRPSLRVNAPGVLEVMRLMGPRLLGLAVVQINFWVNIALASTMVEGSITALQTAYALMFTVLGILGQSLGTAVFPTLSTQHAQGDHTGFQRTFGSALRNVLFLSIPAGLGMAVLSVPIVGTLFERGEWTTADTQATAWALVFYSIGLAGHAALEILARTFYALHDTWTPVRIGVGAMLLNILLSVVFVLLFDVLGADSFRRGPFAGLALANSLATALESAILWVILRRRIPAMDTRPIIRTLVRTALAGAGMVGIVLLWLLVADTWLVLFQLVGGILVGAIAFWGLALAMRIEAAQSVPRQILSRFRRTSM
ncbi:MAG: murein biosynthesis integral membrane protein MurJ [Chloroflexi bacterium]|nr:murein biosynthesis integral membrane protein MurJ [Chloroflexota bacterium]